MKILEHKCLIKLNSKQLEICIIKLKDQKSLKIEKKKKNNISVYSYFYSTT